MASFYRIFKELLPEAPLLVGVVSVVADGGCVVTLVDGGEVFARGEATVGQKVFVRDGVIEGPAPDMTIELIEV